MDWEKIRQLINPLIEDLDLLLQRKENDRSFLMLLQDVLSKYVEISQILQSWDQQTITENLLAGQAAFNEILNGMEQNAPVFQIQEGIYAFGQTLVELERYLSMEEKYFVIIYGINQKTANYPESVNLTSN